MGLPHKHHFEVVFTRQDGAVRYLECPCGQKKSKASRGAKPERPPTDWPDPFVKHRRDRRSARNSTNLY